MEEGRVIALDVGDKRIGIAVSDPTGTIAYPLETYKRKGSGKDVAYIIELAKKMKTVKIVVGLPLLLSGKEGTQARKVKEFVKELESAGLEIELVDERYSTEDADSILRGKGQNWKERKSKRDAVAAAIILDAYLKEKKE
ncbi:MAG: Holliday junction resolvase RuvX [Candidatus Aminicenantes bacterium]|nr:Holliday junction resolvase RuvX [Candidatus Aminicenantes bacterium]